MTQYEQEIHEIIRCSAEHLTVEQIFHRMKEKHPGIVLATIYNNVNRLWEAGLIRRVSIEGQPDRYDRPHRHDHLVCRRCGRLTDISFDDLTAPLRERIGENFFYYDLNIFYLCPACLQNEFPDKEDSHE
ncbi:MAG: transcriptional repressor [Lachnospiraceae bacterium]|nr:transcriptional repressor [Lachnospiraceae bacterium]